MQLLEKTKINQDIAKERKDVIDSGIFLAKKVDTLRQDLLSLEEQRDNFIKGSREKLEIALRDLTDKKSFLEGEIKLAEKRLATLREPLDEEWKNLELLKDEVLNVKIESEQYFQSLLKERSDLAKQKEWVDELQETALINYNETAKYLGKATEDRKQTKKALADAKWLKENKEAELYLREVALETKEKNLKEREATLKKEKLEFNKEKKLLELKKTRWKT